MGQIVAAQTGLTGREPHLALPDLPNLPDRAGPERRVPGAEELLAFTEDTEDRLALLGVGARPYLDLYIPSTELRAKWEDDPLLVAADPLRPEAEVGTLTAYRLDGERVEISATETPELRLLVISPDEHDTHRPPRVDVPKPGVAKDTPDEADIKGAQLLSYHGGSDSIGAPYLRVADNTESKF